MEDTLASIRPSGNRSVESGLSFLYGRDPSILAYGQMPPPCQESKKNLESLYEDEEQHSRGHYSSIPSLSALGDTVKVYLRMKPFPQKMRLTEQQKNAYQIIDANTLLTKVPSLDTNSSSLKRPKGSDTVSRKFIFTNTFGPETTQLQFFEQAVKHQMTQFLDGQSATVMSYGTTNAGKSYTLQGTTASPGIIPRGLEFVFSNINPRSTPCYKPLYNKNVVSLDTAARAYEMELKTKLLSFGSIDKNQYIQAYRTMQQLLQDESPLKPNESSDANYSVWVSFAEIYNETIFDLLSNDCQKKRQALKLATDSSGKAFIRDLKMVCVNSGSEAYQLLMAGQYNLRVAATALNARSSRSHCIFTIKILKYYKENAPAEVEVSTFSFCDLAGSERLKKTLNAGERLKEAQNINTSLLVLGRCLKSIFEAQSSKAKHEVIGPFRESKLTRLFQSALSGKENIALIVNVNPVPNMYIETQNVLNFSAIAKQIVLETVIPVRRRASHSRFSQIVTQSLMTVTDWDVTDLENTGEEESCHSIERPGYVHVEDYDEVVQENKTLKKEVEALKNSALNMDFEIRREMSNLCAAMIDDLETNFKNRLQTAEEQQEDMLEWSVKQVEDYYKQKLNKIKSKKRSHLSSGGESDQEINIEELEAENVQLTAKIEALKKSVKELRESREKLVVENNQNIFELSLAKKDLQNCKNLLHAAQSDIGCGDEASKVIEELKKQLLARDDQIKSLKVYLDEAKAEWVKLSSVETTLEESLLKKKNELLESLENIRDLSEQLEQANVCLANSTKTVETLEDKLDLYVKKLAIAEENLQNAEDKWNKSSANNLVVLKENESLKKMLDEEVSRSSADNCVSKTQALELERLKNVVLHRTDELQELNCQIDAKDVMLHELKSKLSDSENENSLLKNKLLQSNDHTKLLREELNLTKATLGDITDQINSLKVADAAKATTVDVDSQTSFVNDDKIVESEYLVCIKQENTKDDDEASLTNGNQHEDRDSETIWSKEIYAISNDEKSDDETSEKLKQLTMNHNDLKTLYLYETSKAEERRKELDRMKQELSSLKTSFDASEEKVTEYKNLLESIKNELSVSESALATTVKESEVTKREKLILESEISECKTTVEQLRSNLEESEKKNTENSETSEENLKKVASLEAELTEAVEKLHEMTSRCLTEHIVPISKLEKDIAAATERDVIKEQLLEAHIQRISKLEKDLVEAANFEEKLRAFENNVKTCEEEKANLQRQLDENSHKLLSLENELQVSITREQEKENETILLQKEMKNMIQMTANQSKRDTEMEKEVKNTLRELAAAEKALADSKMAFKELERSSAEKILRLEMRVETFEERAGYLTMLKDGAEKKEAETEQLRNLNEDLRREIEQKNQEMVSFNKNRDETIQRYETLVKQLQEDLERSKHEVKRFQQLFLRQSTPTPCKEEIKKLKDELRSKTSLLEQVQDKLKKSESLREEKENIVNTSEDEITSIDTRRTRKKGRNNAPAPAASDISVIELSGSELKRVTRRTALAPPTAVPSTEKRQTRKKKLFASVEENCQDVEPTESTPRSIMRSPLSATRSLRNRRK